MDYDFFDEEVKREEGQGSPAPQESDSKKNAPTPPAPKESGGKKIWQIVGAVTLAIVLFLLGMTTCWFTLDPEIRTLIKVKNKIQDEYYQGVSDGEFYDAVFNGINEGLLDDYSKYMTEEEYKAEQQSMDGRRIGVGLIFYEEEELRVSRVCGNSPAEEAGIDSGDKLVGFGEAEESVLPCEKFDDLTAFLKTQEEGQKFYFRLENLAGEERSVELYKSEYVENNVFYRTKESAYAFEGKNATLMTKRGEPMLYLDEDTAYIRLVQFSGNAATAFGVAMQQFKADGKKNLVLDLRGNGGGYVATMQSIASYFCRTATTHTPVVMTAKYGKRTESYRAYGNVYGEYFQEDSQIYLLADAGSASASECLIGVMVDYGAVDFSEICLIERGGVAKTYGKGIMQEIFRVNYNEKDALKLTTAEIFWPLSKRSIHGRGVLPEDGAITAVGSINFEEETRTAIEELLFK